METSRQEWISGRHEHSCALCWCTNHDAIGADKPLLSQFTGVHFNFELRRLILVITKFSFIYV